MAQLCDGRLTAREADRELDERGLRPHDCSIVAAGGVLPAGERQLHLNLGRGPCRICCFAVATCCTR